MNKKHSLLILGIYLLSLFNFASIPTVTFAQEDVCPIAHSHQSGDLCVCDQYYRPEGGICVPMSDSEICPIPNSHQVGNQCLCNDGYLPAEGRCVDPYAFCANHHATFSPAISDCKCNKGFVMNASGDDCLPITQEEAPAPKTTEPAPTEPAPIPISTKTEPLAPIATPSEPTSPTPTLYTSTEPTISLDPILKASLENAPKIEIETAQKEKEAIQTSLKFDADNVELQPTSEQKLNIVKGSVIATAVREEKNWEDQVNQAEKDNKVKPEKQKDYDNLKNREQSLLTQYEQNQEALNVLGKQSLQIISADQPGAPYMWNQDQKFKDAPKRDFMKESQGDPNMALVYATQATAAQMKLLSEIKADLRKVREQKRSLLDVPAKPDTEAKLKQEGEKMGWEKDWYK